MHKLRKRLAGLGVPHTYDSERNYLEVGAWSITKLGKDYLGYRLGEVMPSWQGGLHELLALLRPAPPPTRCGYCDRPAALHCESCHLDLCLAHKTCPGCETEEVVTRER